MSTPSSSAAACGAGSPCGAASPSPASCVALFALGASGDHLSDHFGNKQIARVAIEGTILESRDQLELLKRVGDAKHVKAVLVFVNSPGGTTTGGEALFVGAARALQEEAGRRPVRHRRGLGRLHRRARRRLHRLARQHDHRLGRRARPVARSLPDAGQDRRQGERDQKRRPRSRPVALRAAERGRHRRSPSR